jgi:hypothetical protein
LDDFQAGARGRLELIAAGIGRDKFDVKVFNIVPPWGLIAIRQPNKPAEQQIVAELLHQLPLRAHRIESL